MKSDKPLREVVILFTGLLAVGLVTAAIITTFRGDGAEVSPQATGSSLASATLIRTSTIIPYPEPLTVEERAQGTRTALLLTEQAFVSTHRAISTATELATTRTPTLSPEPVTPYPTGTAEGNSILALAKAASMDALNVWYGIVDGNQITLVAGSSGRQQQGAVRIFVTYKTVGGFDELFLTPTQHGAVRVIAELNNRLTLVSTDGTIYYFDVPALRFVASLTEVVPTATTHPPMPDPLLPTPYPVPTETSTSLPY